MQSLKFYGIEIQGYTNDIHLNKLKVTINKIIKFILKLPGYANNDFGYNELKHNKQIFLILIDYLKHVCYYLYINTEMLFQNVNIILKLGI